MSFTKIYEDRDSFEEFKKLLPHQLSFDIPESRIYKFFKAIGKEFMFLRDIGQQIASSRWLGVPDESPNCSPDEITSKSSHIKMLKIGGGSLSSLGSLLNLPIYQIVNEREKSYRERLVSVVREIFGGGTKPSLINILKFATKRFDGQGLNQNGYTPIVIEPFKPISKWGTLSSPPTHYDSYFCWGTFDNIPSRNEMIYNQFNLDNDYSKYSTYGHYNIKNLHFIIRFDMDNNVGSPTDYEYWGGKYINNQLFNREYVNNYLFLMNIVQQIKLAGITFEIQIMEL